MHVVLLFCALLLSVSSVFPPAGSRSSAAQSNTTPKLLRRTKHFDIYLAPGSLRRAEALQLTERLEPTLQSVAQRFGTSFDARERIELLPAQKGACAVRGLTFSSKRLIQLFYGPGSDIEQMQALVAHEFVHQLQRERFGDRAHRAADNILLEGWAMLASDEFARTADGAEPRWRARLREAVARNELQPLKVNLDRDCRTTTRNIMYVQWASFVDFLEQHYGNQALARVYSKGKGRTPGSADYANVFNKSFDELEADWRDWVVSQ
jgi:hypothetical protein